MDMVRGFFSRASSSLFPSPANFLRFSEENVQRINNLLARHGSKNISILNERQCRDLSSKLVNALESIKELIGCCGGSSTTPFTPAFENFFRISEKAKLLVLSCSSTKWLEASVFQLQNQEAFREILVEAGLCYYVIYEQAKVLNGEERDIKLLDNLFQSSQWMFTPPSIADVQTDQKTLERRLEDLTNNRSSSNLLKQQSLARYLLGNLKCISQAGDVDMLGAMLWDHEKEPPGTWTEEKYLGASTNPVFTTTWLDIPCAKKVFRAQVEEHEIFEKEVRILAHLNHPNIVKFMCCGNGAKNGQCFIGMELMQMSLVELIKVRGEDPKPFPPIVAVDIIVQIARGVCYLHDLGIAHRDLKTPNVVVNNLRTPHLVENFCVKLIDFGLSKTKLEVSKSVTVTAAGIGTTIYRAPEVHPKARTPDGLALRRADWFRADVYSFGITCAEILSLTTPFKNIPKVSLYEEVMSGRRPDLPENYYPEKLLALVKECWNEDPRSRPNFLHICTRLEEIIFDLLMKSPPTDGEGLQQVTTNDISYKHIKRMLTRFSRSRNANSFFGEEEAEFESNLEVSRSTSADKEHSSRIMVGQFIGLYTRFRTERWWNSNMPESDNFEEDEYVQHNNMPYVCEHTWEILLAPDNNDLICIKKFETESNSTEIHILNADSKYQCRRQSRSCLHECADHNFVFALAQNRDLFAIKRHQTGSGRTEVHILSASSAYQEFSLQIPTPVEESHHENHQFLVAANRDLYFIKKSKTGTKRTEVHILSASSNYQSFVLEVGTCLIETDLSWDFIGLGQNNDLHAIRRSNRRLGETRMYILTRASEYKELSTTVNIQLLPKTDHKFAFAMARNLDLFVIQKANTTSGNVDLQVLSFSSKYQELQSQYSTALPETDCICEIFGVTEEVKRNHNGNSEKTAGFIFRNQVGLTEGDHVPDQDLVLVKRNHNGNSGKTAVFIFRNQVGCKVLCERFYTILPETNHTFDFGLAANRDLFVVKKSNTRPTCCTEIHILDGSTNYSSFKLQIGTPLPKTDHTWKFLVAENRDLIAIQKSNTNSKRTEICVLIAASAYQSFGVRGCSTILEETDDAWDFLMAPNNDLLAIHKYHTKSGHTEINVLSSKSNYQEFTFQAVTDLHETDYNTTFILTSDLTLVPIRKSRYPFSWNLA